MFQRQGVTDSSTAYVLINCDLGSEERVMSELKSINRIKEIRGVFGAYDILAKVDAPSDDLIRDIVTSKIRRIDRIRSTLTLMGIEGQE
ncbi:MAG TPA: Lrp/AsnC ligand binding domain-containing protein [Candidatus Nitrosotenuis sp.]|nr:Lrp/AsnC ligand binding domain-containing protein [Candidatus Nitrosotenuis sp.]